MTSQQLDQWTKHLGDAWTNLDPDAALAIVDKETVTWYESPLDQPLTSWQAVYDVWKKDLSEQKDVSFSHQVLACEEGQGIVRWQAQLTRESSNEIVKMDGIFLITLNEGGLCTNFCMWIESK